MVDWEEAAICAGVGRRIISILHLQRPTENTCPKGKHKPVSLHYSYSKFLHLCNKCNTLLLLVGGEETSTGRFTNQLWVFEEGEQTWTQPLPPMPNRRTDASAVSYQDYLIVAGGHSLNTVEVFDGQQWVTADPLPERCCSMKSTSHDGHYYLMGGNFQGTSVFYTSLQSLVEKATQHPPTSPSNTDQLSVWKTLAATPHEWSSTTIFGGALVAVGGCPNQSSLHFYFPLTQSWLPAGEMPLGENSTCTVTLPTGEMMVIGGKTSDTDWSPLVYKARVKLQ